MLPVGDLDPKKMQKMLKQFGIESKEIQANQVIIFTPTTKIIINQPQIIEIDIKGNKNYQISGDISIEPNISEEDIKLVMENTGCDKEKAIEALKKSNMDIAKAILDLNEKK
jgi:nascent polypeptide-associated complex subunit alpha